MKVYTSSFQTECLIYFYHALKKKTPHKWLGLAEYVGLVDLLTSTSLNIAYLKIGGYTLFDGRYVTKPKIFSKQDRGINFFSVKAEMLRFSNRIPRRLPEALFWYEILKFFKIFKKIQNFQIKIDLRGASWRPPDFPIWKEEHLSFHWKKKLSLYLV